MKKNDIFFLLLLLFVTKLILLPVGFPDAAVLLVLLSYRPVSQYLKLQRDVKISAENAEKFAEVSGEIENIKKTLESIKTKEQVLQSFGMKK